MEIYFIILAALLIIAAAITSILVIFNLKKTLNPASHKLDTEEGTVEYHTDDETPYLVKRLADGTISDKPFKVVSTTDLHLRTDLHLAGATDYAFSLKVLARLLDRDKPDLLVLVGDVIVSTPGYDLHRELGEFFEKRGQYWAYVLGNHDAEGIPDGRAKFVEAFAGFPHCLTRNESNGAYGDTNFIINVKGSKGNVIESLVFMDSGISRGAQVLGAKYGYPNASGDDFLKPDQIEWYVNRLKKIAEDNGAMPKSLVFMHIPLPEYDEAYKKFHHKKEHIFGYKVENCCSQGINCGFLDAALALGSTEAIIAGHEHDNDFCINYKGIKLMYSQSLPYLAYNARKVKLFQTVHKLSRGRLSFFTDGTTIYMLKADEPTDIVPMLNSKNPSIFDGLEAENHTGCFLK